MRVGGYFRYESGVRHREQTDIRNSDVRRIGRSYRYDSAHIPSKAEAASTTNRAVIRSKDAIIRRCYKQAENKKIQASGQQDASHKTFPSRTPSGRRSENWGDFRQENRTVLCDQIPSRRTAAKPSWRKIPFRHELHFANSTSAAARRCAAMRLPEAAQEIFVKIFLLGESHPDPLHYPAVSTYLEFSCWVTPKRRIRAGGRLIVGAKMVRNFRQEIENARDKISRA